MLQNTRESAGLGSSPHPYYTNAVESVNSLLKLRTKHKKQDLPTFITTLKEVVESQFTDVDRALAGLGDYKVANEYHFDACKVRVTEEKVATTVYVCETRSCWYLNQALQELMSPLLIRLPLLQ